MRTVLEKSAEDLLIECKQHTDEYRSRNDVERVAKLKVLESLLVSVLKFIRLSRL